MYDNYFGDAMGRLILRLTVGGLMLLHGIAKLGNPGTFDFISGKLAGMGLPPSLAYAVFIGELLAPLMLILGYHARFAGFIIVVNMIVAVGLVHMGDLLSLGKHGGWLLELQAFYLFGALTIIFLGGGRFAVRPD